MDTQVKVAIISGIFCAIIAPLMTEVVVPLIRRWLGLERVSEVSSSRTRMTSIVYIAIIGGIIGALLGYLVIAPVFFSP